MFVGAAQPPAAAIIAATLPPQLNYTAAICVDLPWGEGGQATVSPPDPHSNLSRGGTAWHCPPSLASLAWPAQAGRDAATPPIPVGSHSKSSGDPGMTNITGGRRGRGRSPPFTVPESKFPVPGDHVLPEEMPRILSAYHPQAWRPATVFFFLSGGRPRQQQVVAFRVLIVNQISFLSQNTQNVLS